MKKIVLSILGICAVLSSMGQYKEVNSPVFENKTVSEVSQIKNVAKTTPGLTGKTRASRYYSYISSIDAVDYASAGLLFSNVSFPPIWQDSTILQRYSTGYGPINYSSFSASINPSNLLFNDPSTYGGEMEITSNDSYTIDSVIIFGAYVTPDGTGAKPGDKLTISIVKSGDSNQTTWSLRQSYGTVGANYLTPNSTTDTSVRGLVPSADSVASIGGYPTRPRVTWDYVFTNADTGTLIKRWAFAPPSPITVPAGGIASMSMTFVSNDTWTANVDSVGFNAGCKAHFRPRFYEEGSGQLMTYRDFSERNGGDLCTSGLMFSTNRTRYLPAVIVEAFNDASFSREHLDVDWVLNCTTCGTVSPIGTNDIVAELESISIYPIPANEALNINLNELKKNNVNVTLFSITGQKLMNTSIAKGNTTATLDLSSIPAGMYLCELEINGQTKTTKVTKN